LPLASVIYQLSVDGANFTSREDVARAFSSNVPSDLAIFGGGRNTFYVVQFPEMPAREIRIVVQLANGCRSELPMSLDGAPRDPAIDAPFGIALKQYLQPGFHPDAPPDLSVFKFEISGVDLRNIDRGQSIHTSVAGGWQWLFGQEVAILVNKNTQPGPHTLSVTLPDGQVAETSFEYSP
jgi:hypothetical protein